MGGNKNRQYKLPAEAECQSYLSSLKYDNPSEVGG